jgi:hypothetical protein
VEGAAERPVVGLFGAFDTGELGEVALRRVIEWELRRRRPDIDLIAVAPFGAERPIPGDEGRPAIALPTVTGAEAPGLDALIIAGDVLGDDQHWAGRYPVPLEEIVDRGVGALALTARAGGRDVAPWVTWFAVGSGGGDVDATGLEGRNVWARDLAIQERLGGTTVQSGDPVLTAGSLFSPEVLRRRADLLRICGALPAGRRLVIETAPSLVASSARALLADAVSAVLRADPKLSVVVVNLDPTQTSVDSAFRLSTLNAERVHHLPSWAGLDDIAAVMAGSLAVVATSPAGAHLAAGLGAPVSVIDTGLGSRFDTSIPMLGGDLTTALQALVAGGQAVALDGALQTLDGAFSELAERLPRTAASARTALAPDAVDTAISILQRRLVEERTALQAELSRMQAELEHLQATPEHRIARPIREGYRRWQRRRT